MPDDSEPTAPYRGEFRYVFHVSRQLYDATVAFYRDALRFPVVGGFPAGTYFQASVGVIEVITDPADKAPAKGPPDDYQPPHKGWLLIEVPDLADAYHWLIESKAAPLWEPTERAWRFRDVGVKDPCGNLICLFSRLQGWEEHH
jgi:catechol 2,3-dioxygenase-like lactoylglutathione lyase family enzyme